MNLLVTFLLFTWTWASGHCDGRRDKIFFLQKTSDNETLLVVTWTESEQEISAGCEMFTDKDLIDEVLKSSAGAEIRTLSEDEMQNLLGDCTEFSLRRRRRDVDDESVEESDNEATGPSSEDIDDDSKELRRNGNKQRNPQRKRNPQGQRNPQGRGRQGPTRRPQENRQEAPRRGSSTRGDQTTTETPTTTPGYDGIPVIFPGTKWCGAGDRAKNYDDLGLHQDTDRCCRAHDLCNDTLAPGETRNSLTNKTPFTKLSCKCDQDFYDCLARVNTVTSNTIGNTYFNLLKSECYKKDYPVSKKCKKYLTLLKLTCVAYERNRSKPKVYQWVPAKKYKQIPFPGPLTVTLPF